MTRTSVQALSVARPVVRGLMVLNIVYACAIAALLAWSFFIAGWPQRPLGFDLVHAHPLAGLGLRVIVVVGVVGAAIVHTILRRLLAIIDTVRVGDPFILDNAQRLEAIAWRVLGLERLRFIVAAIAAAGAGQGGGGGLSFAPSRGVVCRFLLARAVAPGATTLARLS